MNCTGPDDINIDVDNESTSIKIAMTVAHELMHIYFHQLKHFDKCITYINGEEGLCELVAYYVGLFIKSKGKTAQHSKETYRMLQEVSEEEYVSYDDTNQHTYLMYKKYFLKALTDYNNHGTSLIEYINSVIKEKGLVKICN
jgi:Zn-dependent peptidase ImmA (M78 family)